MSNTRPILRLVPPQKVTNGDTVGPLQYTLSDTARLLAVSRRTVERLISQGELDSIGTGKLRRVPYDSILHYMDRHRNEAA